MKKSKSLKNEVIQIRVTKEEKKAIIEKAVKAGL